MNKPPKIAAEDGFLKSFGEPAQHVQIAPGRVNLIGEHTDYNQGFVLPAAIQFHTAVAIGKRQDRQICVVALNQHGAKSEFSVDGPIERDLENPWSNYIRGVVVELRKRGYQLSGANLVVAGNVPIGAGLSSSAALEIATAASLTRISNEVLSGVLAAQIGQAAENQFFGCQCGIMDQMASALCQQQHALLLDCRSMQFSNVKIPDELCLMVINSNVQRGLVDSEYDLRRRQCERVAEYFDVAALRDVSMTMLLEHRQRLPEVEFRRARHVVTENDRTVQFAKALQEGDYSTAGRLMQESHKSMRDDFEITVAQIDGLVNLVQNTIGSRGGVRMTGGGFGGCVVALFPQELRSSVEAAVLSGYSREHGLDADIYVCTAEQGAFA